MEGELAEPVSITMPIALEQDQRKVQNVEASQVRLCSRSKIGSPREWVDITDKLEPPAKLEDGVLSSFQVKSTDSRYIHCHSFLYFPWLIMENCKKHRSPECWGNHWIPRMTEGEISHNLEPKKGNRWASHAHTYLVDGYLKIWLKCDFSTTWDNYLLVSQGCLVGETTVEVFWTITTYDTSYMLASLFKLFPVYTVMKWHTVEPRYYEVSQYRKNCSL